MLSSQLMLAIGVLLVGFGAACCGYVALRWWVAVSIGKCVVIVQLPAQEPVTFEANNVVVLGGQVYLTTLKRRWAFSVDHVRVVHY